MVGQKITRIDWFMGKIQLLEFWLSLWKNQYKANFLVVLVLHRITPEDIRGILQYEADPVKRVIKEDKAKAYKAAAKNKLEE